MTNPDPVFEVSSAWRVAYPDAHAGILVMRGAANPAEHPELQAQKEALEKSLRAQYAGSDRAAISALPTIEAYNAYYKRFNKSYHVQLQLESIVLKGKNLPRVAALVEAMFMAEIKNLMLTAGHDFDALQLPLVLDPATGEEHYTLLRGEEQITKAGDMMISDRAGVVSSIVYGPDQRTQIHPETRNVLFAVYAPRGISPEAIARHLENIAQNVKIISPHATVELLQVFG
jgi:DNA/RNA-binding domain of Phe-tRNA-synthetase-like protein